ncbi:hypothetical protein [Pseudomarimonas salicorniae]|uniref:Uncharacterized protein n=1 Tax=Pseudomarimonas salicorniae TaxID=2933270 RepID=A0ABT0GG82_9GAMM|nr:hypothetical protein [Lysobacter sp. CAU 1642]MCK7593540.1 hypothetical protein [Lysobacter sp. CAU 1642]
MKRRRWMYALLGLVGFGLAIGCAAEQLPADPAPDGEDRALSLEGRTFDGRIRARGLFGLVRVRGTLSFEAGQLVWQAQGSRETAPYQVETRNGILLFSARVIHPDGSFVDWAGIFDGERLRGVVALWDRSQEKDFIHDLLLPTQVTLEFSPDAGAG